MAIAVDSEIDICKQSFRGQTPPEAMASMAHSLIWHQLHSVIVAEADLRYELQEINQKKDEKDNRIKCVSFEQNVDLN